jgi:beta-mannosidase
MFATSGSLIWQYDEPWPAVTFSLVDFFGRPKAAYYWVRHAYAPVMGLFYAAPGGLTFWGVSDLLEETPCTARLRRFDHSGELLGEASLAAPLRPNAPTMLLASLPPELVLARPEHEFLHAELRAGDRVSECVYHAAERKDWALSPTALTASAKRVEADRVQVTLSSRGYVHFVSVRVGDAAARYSDNFVELLPDSPRTIDIQTRDAGEIIVRAANAAEHRLPIHPG